MRTGVYRKRAEAKLAQRLALEPDRTACSRLRAMDDILLWCSAFTSILDGARERKLCLDAHREGRSALKMGRNLHMVFS